MTPCSDKKFPPSRLPLLEERYTPYMWSEKEQSLYREAMAEPFSALVFTLLSQNTSSVNTRRAYQGLRAAFAITPRSLAAADVRKVARAIRPGGLHRVKARRLQEMAAHVLDHYKGSLAWVSEMPPEEARERLLTLPGIGPKTADVLLASLHGQRRALVVDTHMARIARRLGLVEAGASYEEIQRSLTLFLPWDSVPPERRDHMAALFWLLARHTCTARRPRCGDCILDDICAHHP